MYSLIHSPLVGPFTWRGVRDVLRSRGHRAWVPSLLDVLGERADFAQEGMLPRWADWYPPEVLAEVLPDEEVRDRFTMELKPIWSVLLQCARQRCQGKDDACVGLGRFYCPNPTHLYLSLTTLLQFSFAALGVYW